MAPIRALKLSAYGLIELIRVEIQSDECQDGDAVTSELELLQGPRVAR